MKKKTTSTKRKTTKIKKSKTSKIVVTTEGNTKNSSFDASIIMLIVGILCFVPSLLIPWLEYWKVSKDFLDICISIRATAIPLGILCFCAIPIYRKMREDRKDEYTYKEMKLSDKIYRYISPDVVYAILGFSFIGIATLIVDGINETSFIVEKIGDEMLTEALILAPLATIFYTIWILFCNRLKTKVDKLKYVIAILLIISIIIFIAIG